MGGLALPGLIAFAGGAVLLLSYAMIRPALILAILSGAALAFFYRCLTPTAARRMGQAPLWLGLGMPIAAWAMPSVWLLYGVMIAGMMLLGRDPARAAPNYLFALLLLPGLDLTISIGSLKLFEFGLHDALAVGAALRVAARRGSVRGGPAPVRLGLDLPFIGVLLLLVVATARDTTFTNFFRVLVNTGLDCALPYYIFSRGIRSMDDLRLCLLHLAGAAAILSVILLYEARSSWPIYNMLIDRYHIPLQLIVKARGGVLRAGGPFLESTSIAMVLTFCFLAGWLSRAACRSRWHHLALLALLFLGMTAPQSRGAWIGLIFGMIAADIYRRRPGAALRRIGLIGGAGLALMAIAPMSPYLSETLGLSGGSTESADYRQILFQRGMEEFWRSPIVGYSSPEILERLADLRQGEGIIDFVNTYVYVALFGGLIGLTVFIGAFLVYIAQAWRWRGRMGVGAADFPATAFIFAGLIMPMEMLFFTSFGGRPEQFVFIFFAFATAAAGIHDRAIGERNVAARQAARQRATDAPRAPVAIRR